LVQQDSGFHQQFCLLSLVVENNLEDGFKEKRVFGALNKELLPFWAIFKMMG